MSDMFSLKEVDVLIADIDILAVRQKRMSEKSTGSQSSLGKNFFRVYADILIGNIDLVDAK